MTPAASAIGTATSAGTSLRIGGSVKEHAPVSPWDEYLELEEEVNSYDDIDQSD